MGEKPNDRLYNFTVEAIGGLVVAVVATGGIIFSNVAGAWINHGIGSFFRAIGWLP